MTELQLHGYLVLGIYAAAAATFVALFFVTAPYGRHLRAGWGPTVTARLGWMVMESPAVLLFAGVFALGANALQATPLVLLSLWQFHYVYRTFVYPFRLPQSTHRMPLSIVAMAILFNCVNAYCNARWISGFGTYPAGFLLRPAFVLGVVIFLAGWAINQHADHILLRLRAPGDTGYRIPQGGLYRLVSCPNYLGEMLTWAGWAVAAWSAAGLAFAAFTMANLLPRAVSNHRWYRREFADYPANRRAVIPFLL